MKILFFDTETTGLPKDYDEPYTNSDNWTRLVQLSWIIEDSNKKELEERDFIIKPDGFVIPEKATKIHHIRHDWAERNGKDLFFVLHEFYSYLMEADLLVGHNIDFDINIVAAEVFRLENKFPGLKYLAERLHSMPIFCTMETGKYYTKIETDYSDDYKWPKLIELYRHLFGCNFKGAHNSLDDIRATRECFWEMLRLDITEELKKYIKQQIADYEATFLL